MGDFLRRNQKKITVGGAVLLIIVMALIVQAVKPEPKSVAEPPEETEVTFDLDKNKAYTAEDGIIVIPASMTPMNSAESGDPQPVPAITKMSVIADTPEAALSAAPTKTGSYTLPEQAQMSDGSIGVLSIPTIGVAVNVFETDDEMEAMTHGLAHFKTTSSYDGNIGLCGHNVNFDLTDGYFKNLHRLSIGDSVTYKTALGKRTYTVSEVKEIAQDDWSYLGRTDDNRVTMVTCISGSPAKRLVVQAVEK